MADSGHVSHYRIRGALNQHVNEKLKAGEIYQVPRGTGYRIIPDKFKAVDPVELQAKIYGTAQ